MRVTVPMSAFSGITVGQAVCMYQISSQTILQHQKWLCRCHRHLTPVLLVLTGAPPLAVHLSLPEKIITAADGVEHALMMVTFLSCSVSTYTFQLSNIYTLKLYRQFREEATWGTVGRHGSLVAGASCSQKSQLGLSRWLDLICCSVVPLAKAFTYTCTLSFSSRLNGYLW